MTITFYSMGTKCAYCVKAENILKDKIKDGTIIVKPASEANGKFVGFPSFHSSQSDKKHSGCPSSYQHLLELLEHKENKENYQYNNLRISDTAKKCCSGLKFITTDPTNPNTKPDKTFKYGLCLCFTDLNMLLTSDEPIGIDSIGASRSTNIFVSSPEGKLEINDIVSDVLIDWSDIQKQLVADFQCTKESDWSLPSDPNDLNEEWVNKMKNLQNLLKPCKEDNSVYCCPGVDGPNNCDYTGNCSKNSVWVNGLIITSVVFVILAIIIAIILIVKKIINFYLP